MHLLIEFVVADQDAPVVFYRPELAEREEGFDISARELLFIERVSPRYAGRNLLAIARDSFGHDREDAEELIALEIDP